MALQWIASVMSGACKALGLVLVLTATAGVACAGEKTPELDPGSLASAVTLAIGGALMLTDRLRRK
jgi:hypothetical protein